jgi:PAS domain S-box-containing protein
MSASYAAVDLGGRIAAARGWVRWSWLAGGAATMGFGIWAMHFTGMLAFSLPVPVGYDWPVALLSLAIAIFLSAVALYVVSRPKMGIAQILTGSVIIGAGIAALHYVAMASMRLAVEFRFSPLLVTLAVALAILISFPPLWLAFHFREETLATPWRKIASAIVLGAAISVMHYTGMASASFLPSPLAPDLSHAVSISTFGTMAIAVVTLMVQALAVLTSFVDRRFAAQTYLRKSSGQQEQQTRALIDAIPQQIWSGPADGSLDFCNERWRSYMGLELEELRGEGWQSMLHPDDRERVLEAWHKSVTMGTPYEQEERHRGVDGTYRWFLARGLPMRDAEGRIVRWYGTNTDIEDLKRAEEAVKQAEDRIRLIIDTIPTMVWTLQPDGAVDFVNQRWMDYTGLSLEEELKEPTRPVHPEDLPGVVEKWLVDVAAGESSEDEMRLRRADGEYRWFLVRTAPLRDKQGNLVKWFGLSIDIEDRKRAEEGLQQARVRIESVLDSVADTHILFDRNWHYLYVNEAAVRAIGHPREQILGRTLWELYPDIIATELDRQYRRAMGERVPVALDFFYPARGTWWENRFHPAPEGLAVFATDITERKRAEEARRQIEEQHRMVVETAIDAVVTIDESSKILFVNPATTRIFGYEPSELIGQPLTMLMPEFMRETHKAGLQRYLATGQHHINWQGTELAGLRKYGEEFPVEVSFGEVMKDGRHTFTGFIRDITERRRAEEELRRLSGQLLRLQDEERRRIARDLHDSTGQNLVALATSLAQLQASIPTRNRKSRRLLSDSQSLADQCIREVRTLSYLLHPPMLEEAGLEDAIRLYVEGFTKRSGIQVEVEVSPQFGRLDREAELTLFRVVQESLTNVRRHSGSLRAEIRMERGAKKVTLEVSDRGSGISGIPPRRNGDSSFRIGVGIASMQERVKLIGGRLDIESGDSGTTVRVTISVNE